jgi:hypothetical protein
MPTETRARAVIKEPLERNDGNLESRDDAGQNVSSADQLGHQDVSLQEELLRGQEASRRGDSYFQREILNTVDEQRVLMIDYKETHDRQLFELTGELKGLSLDFSRLCDKSNELEHTVFDLHAKIGQLETTNKLNEERLVAVHAGMLASSQEIIKTELRGEFSTAFEEFRTEMLHEKRSTRERLERPEIKLEQKSSYNCLQKPRTRLHSEYGESTLPV